MAQVFNRAIPLLYLGLRHHRDDWHSKLSLCLVVHVKPEPARNSRGQSAQDYCLILPRLRSQFISYGKQGRAIANFSLRHFQSTTLKEAASLFSPLTSNFVGLPFFPGEEVDHWSRRDQDSKGGQRVFAS